MIGCYHNIGVIYQSLKQPAAADVAYKSAQKYTTQLNKLQNNNSNHNNTAVLKSMTSLIQHDIRSIQINHAKQHNSKTAMVTGNKKVIRMPLIITQQDTDIVSGHTIPPQQQYSTISSNDIIFASDKPLPVSISNKLYAPQSTTNRPYTSCSHHRPSTTTVSNKSVSISNSVCSKPPNDIITETASSPFTNTHNNTDGQENRTYNTVVHTNDHIASGGINHTHELITDNVNPLQLISPERYSISSQQYNQPQSDESHIIDSSHNIHVVTPNQPKYATLVIGGEYPF